MDRTGCTCGSVLAALRHGKKTEKKVETNDGGVSELLATAESKAELLSQQLRMWEQEKEQNNEQIKNLNIRLVAQRQEIAQLRGELGKTDGSYHISGIEDMTRPQLSMTGTDSTTQQVDALQSTCEAIFQDLDLERHKTQSLNNELQARSQEIAQLQQRLSELELYAQNANNLAQQYRLQADEFEQHVPAGSSIGQEVMVRDQMIIQLKQELEVTNQDVMQIRDQWQIADQQVQAKTMEVAQLQQEMLKLNAGLEAAQAAPRTRELEINGGSEQNALQLQQLEQENMQLKQELTTVSQTLQQQDDQIAQLQAALSRVEEEVTQSQNSQPQLGPDAGQDKTEDREALIAKIEAAERRAALAASQRDEVVQQVQMVETAYQRRLQELESKGREVVPANDAELQEMSDRQHIHEQRIGDLEAELVATRQHVPDMHLLITIIGARGLRDADWIPGMGTSEPYCVCEIPGKLHTRIQTQVISNTTEPQWQFNAEIPDYTAGDELVFAVFDQDTGKEDDFLGQALLPSVQLLAGGFQGELELNDAGKGIKAVLEVNVMVVMAEGALQQPTNIDPEELKKHEEREVALQELTERCSSYDARVRELEMDVAAANAQAPKAQLVVNIIGARGLQQADARSGRQLSDPFCICEIPGKPGSVFQTPTIPQSTDPAWNCKAVIDDYSAGDVLAFAVLDDVSASQDPREGQVLGKAILTNAQLQQAGFEGELRLSDTGDMEAFLLVRVEVHHPRHVSEADHEALKAKAAEVEEFAFTVGAERDAALQQLEDARRQMEVAVAPHLDEKESLKVRLQELENKEIQLAQERDALAKQCEDLDAVHKKSLEDTRGYVQMLPEDVAAYQQSLQRQAEQDAQIKSLEAQLVAAKEAATQAVASNEVRNKPITVEARIAPRQIMNSQAFMLQAAQPLQPAEPVLRESTFQKVARLAREVAEETPGRQATSYVSQQPVVTSCLTPTGSSCLTPGVSSIQCGALDRSSQYVSANHFKTLSPESAQSPNGVSGTWNQLRCNISDELTSVQKRALQSRQPSNLSSVSASTFSDQPLNAPVKLQSDRITRLPNSGMLLADSSSRLCGGTPVRSTAGRNLPASGRLPGSNRLIGSDDPGIISTGASNVLMGSGSPSIGSGSPIIDQRAFPNDQSVRPLNSSRISQM